MNELKQIAVDYYQQEQAGNFPIPAPAGELPAGLTAVDGNLERVDIPESGVAILRYRGVDGYPAEKWLRRVPWSQLNYRIWQRFWDQGVLPHGAEPSPAVAYQCGSRFNGQLFPDWGSGYVVTALTPEGVAAEGVPWRVLESWDWQDVEVLHTAVWFAQELLRQEREEAAGRRAQAEAEARRREDAEDRARQTFAERCTAGRKLVGYSKGSFDIAVTDGRSVTVEGFLVVTAKKRKPAGFGVHRIGPSAWKLTHLGSGLLLGTLATSEDALTTAGLLLGAWDGWVQARSAGDVPESVKEAVRRVQDDWVRFRATD